MENVEIKFNNLCNWMSTNGGFVNPKLSLINGQFGRTVIANQKIENEDITKEYKSQNYFIPEVKEVSFLKLSNFNLTMVSTRFR
jgi:hypothetical protein